MKHKILTWTLAAVAVSLAACTPAATTIESDTSSSAMMEEEDRMMNDSSDAMMESSKGAMMEDDAMMGDVRVVDVLVTDWSFTPAVVTAKKGEKVQLRLKGDKGIHGLLIADVGINVRIQPGQETVIDIPTATAGTFEGRCNVPCGLGHSDMTFTIVVE